MNKRSGGAPENDETVTAAYRNLASESSPARLDAIILRDAAKPLRSGNGGFWGDAWFRPVTFVATLGLSLALILQLSDSGLLTPSADNIVTDGSFAPPGEDPMRDAAAVTAEQVRRIEAETVVTVPQAPMSRPAAPAVNEPTGVATQLPVEERCSEAQRSDTGTWWQCIEDLEKRGLTDAAEAELRALLAAHPGFPVPE
jgi:hypothetical protein